jgi:soluble lytic murein transglycosylase-like protein
MSSSASSPTETRTRWVSSTPLRVVVDTREGTGRHARSRRFGRLRATTRAAAAVCCGAAVFLAGCKAPVAPTLATAAAQRGDARAQARAYLEVALSGPASQRPRAALLWGLYACDVPSPRSALRAFSLADPTGGRARLASRRLEAALNAAASGGELWQEVGGAPWLDASERQRFVLRGAELLVIAGQAERAARSLPPLDELTGAERGRALAVMAAAPTGGAAAQRRLAVGYPELLAATTPAADVTAIEKTFTAEEWATRAASELESGDATAALRAARRAGSRAALTAARAALRLRHPSEAMAWADRLGVRSLDGALERGEALRQLAWIATGDARRVAFARLDAAAERARRLTGSDTAAGVRADLLRAEAATELGRFAEAASLVARSFDRAQPRWDWVWRRLAFLSAQHHGAPVPDVDPPSSSRVARIAAFWRARQVARGGDPGPLVTLADGGFPDLPAFWAADELKRSPAPAAFAADGAPPAKPPAWAGDLLTAGRVADVVVAWRADLEAGAGGGADWLGLVHLAAMPPLDAIPLLVRGEQRLYSGPWSGLPRSLLEQYLPLPYRTEVETAAHREGVPPWLLAGLVRHESAWSPRARSAAGAVGLAQVLPATGREKGRALGLALRSTADIIDPGNNLLLGASLLADWRRSFGGSWTAALAAYNGGERRVRETWERAGGKDGPEFVEALEVPETWDYVHRVVVLAEGYRLLYWPEGRPYPWT